MTYKNEEDRSKTLELCIVVPIYKSEETLQELTNRLLEIEKTLFDVGIVTRIHFIIDGSPDKSRDVLMSRKRELKKKNWQISSLSRNFGQTSALLAGLSTISANFYICMSADLQDPPELILEMVNQHMNGYSIVIATRNSREDSWLASLTSRIAYGFIRSEIREIPKGGFDFFLISNVVRDKLVDLQGTRRFLQGDIMSLGFSTTFVPYTRRARVSGKSAYSLRKRFKLFLDWLFDVSSKPLRIFTLIGVFVSFFGFLLALLSFVAYIRNEQPIVGFTPIFLGILIFGGLQLISLGVIGEYVMRLYDISRGRHPWIIEKIE